MQNIVLQIQMEVQRDWFKRGIKSSIWGSFDFNKVMNEIYIDDVAGFLYSNAAKISKHVHKEVGSFTIQNLWQRISYASS